MKKVVLLGLVENEISGVHSAKQAITHRGVGQSMAVHCIHLCFSEKKDAEHGKSFKNLTSRVHIFFNVFFSIYSWQADKAFNDNNPQSQAAGLYLNPLILRA